MKLFLAVALLVLPCAALRLRAADVCLAWNAVPGAASYELSVGAQTVSTTATQASVTLAPGHAYTATVRAVNAAGASDPSEPLTVNVVLLILQSSTDLATWSDLAPFVEASSEPQKFYRLTIVKDP